MRERDFIKLVLQDKLPDKEIIRRQVLAGPEPRKGVVSMKRKLITACLSLGLIIAMTYGVYAAAENIEYKKAEHFLYEIGVEAADLTRAQAKDVYRDMVSDQFKLDITQEVLEKRANEMGIEYVPQESEYIYRALKNYSALTYTNRVSLDQVRELEAGLTYGEIIERLGVTKNVGKDSYILQYLVDGKMLLTLTFADESEVCPLSGEELLGTLKRVVTENTGGDTFDAVVLEIEGGRLLVHCPAYEKFDTAWVGLTEKTELVFADGRKASLGDLNDGTPVIITFDGGIRESYPVQITAIKIVISQ